MNTRMLRTVTSGLVLVTLSVSFAGCKSGGFSMPGANMFSWNRKPDAATLAGNTKVPELPESPASKYTASPIASVAAKNSTGSAVNPSNPAMNNPLPKGSGSAYGYSSPTTSSGLAASANGYNTGPYQMNPKPASTAIASTSATGSLPNPYGGTYAGAKPGSSGTDNLTLPTSVANAVAGAGGTASSRTNASLGGYPAFPVATAGPGAGSQATTTSPVSYTTKPASTPAAPTNTASSPTSNSMPAIPPLPPVSSAYSAAGAAAQSATTATTGALPALPALPGTTQYGGVPASANTPINGSYPNTISTPKSYSPGSTGRSTTYDFGSSNGGAGSASGSNLPTGGLPPNTASGSMPTMR